MENTNYSLYAINIFERPWLLDVAQAMEETESRPSAEYRS